MASHLERDGPSKSQRRLLRKSIANLPSPVYAGEDNKENNTADVGAITGMKRASTGNHGPPSKKSRSKSIGPGGLDTLKETSKLQRKESSTGFPIKSILKPAIPLSPLREIPSHRAAPTSSKSSGSGRASFSGTSKHPADENLLIDFSVNEETGRVPISVSGAETLQNPFDVGLGSLDQGVLDAPLSGANNEVHISDDNEKEQRERARKEILERREARRKSLANRRVSFAPEATLHTWNVIEVIQDSTTSSASTSSTGQASALPTPAHAPAAGFQPDVLAPGSDASEAPSTPPQQVDETREQASPAYETDGHRRKRRRRSSEAPSVAGTDYNEERLLSSPLSGSSAMESDDSYSERVFEVDEGDSANTGSESAEGDSTSMSLDDIDATVDSLISAASSQASTASTGRLNEALRQAALHAGTRGIEYDENGDLSMEIANDQITAAFEPWSKSQDMAKNAMEDLTSFQDQENQNPFSPAFQAFVNKGVSDVSVLLEEDDEIDMDMTRPVGKILASQSQPDTINGPILGTRSNFLKQRPSLTPRLSSGEGSSLGDATMDLTMAIGGIHVEPIDMETPEPSVGVQIVPTEILSTPQEMRGNEAERPPTPPIQPAADMNETNGTVAPPSEVAMPVHRKMRLQEFLKLTGIHFMDLTATKRKLHKMSSSGGIVELENASLGENNTELSGNSQTRLEQSVKAASCTLPMLELYQHSCRELKKSISEGRSIIRQIETDVYAENPGLFREYLSAPPDVRLIMDNQFKNVKTYARLSSKAMWYDWRKKLLDDLKGGLCKIQDDMNTDDMTLLQYENLLSSVIPRLVENHELLKQERNRLQAQAEEIARSNQEELARARSDLLAIKEEVEEKRALVEHKRIQIREKQEALEAAIENKMASMEEIREAERIKEECRGWSTSEVRIQKGIADELERNHGWTIAGVKGTTITMIFQRELELLYDASCLPKHVKPGQFQDGSKPILRIAYQQDARAKAPPPVRTIKDVFAQTMNKQVNHNMLREAPKVSKLLAFVSNSWRKADMVAEEYRLLSLHFPTEVSPSEEDALCTKSTVLLPGLSTKLQLAFEVSLFGENSQASVNISPRVDVVYGEQLATSKMQEFLVRRTGSSVSASASEGQKDRRWVTAVKELCRKLSARGKDVSPVEQR